MKNLRRGVILFVCLYIGSIATQAQNSYLGKGSSIVKGGIGFAYVTQNTETQNTITYSTSEQKFHHSRFSIDGAYNILLNQYVYMGVVAGFTHEAVKYSQYNYNYKLKLNYLETGPNIGILLNNDGNNKTIVYAQLNPTYLSNFDNTQGITANIGLGVLIRPHDKWALDIGISAGYRNLWKEGSSYYFPYHHTADYELDGYILQLHLGITGLFSPKKQIK